MSNGLKLQPELDEELVGTAGTDDEIARHSYNRYVAVAGRVVRRSLKEEKRLVAERRGEMELRFAKWEVREPG